MQTIFFDKLQYLLVFVVFRVLQFLFPPKGSGGGGGGLNLYIEVFVKRDFS